MQTISPEEAGICPRAIADFLKTLREKRLPMHSVLLLRGGKLCFEAYAPPYDAQSLHRMYSETKSLTALAIGLLQDEGKLSIDESIASFFPDKAQGADDYARRMTIRDMLRMSTTHRMTAYKIQPQTDWVRAFFDVSSDRRSGMNFAYDTSASHVLAALAERLSGKDLLCYLREKCLDAIGFSKEAYILKAEDGVSMGGSGLMATPRDMARVMTLVAAQGMHEGVQLLPRTFLQEATSLQTDTFLAPAPDVRETMEGYGYQIWRTTHGGYMFYGMGGQLALCVPEKDVILVTTADTQGTVGGVQMIFDAFWETIYEKLSDTPLEADAKGTAHQAEEAARFALPVVPGAHSGAMRARIDGIPYAMDKNAMGMEGMRLCFERDGGTLHYTLDGVAHALPFAMGGQRVGHFPGTTLRCATSGAWRNDRQFLIHTQLIDENIGSVWFSLSFGEGEMTLLMRKHEETLLDAYQGHVTGWAKR